MTDERALAQLLHDTLDRQDVSGPFQRLQIEFEKPSAAQRRRGTRRIFMTRNRLVLLAAALVLIIGISVVVGTRVLTLNHATTTIPAGPTVSVADLLSRPLQIESITGSQQCPNGPEDHANVVFGGGPIYAIPGPAQAGTAWLYGHVGFLTPPGMKGPVIVRGRDVITGQPMAFVSPYGVGPVFGTDYFGTAPETQYNAVAIDPTHPQALKYAYNNVVYNEWQWYNGVLKTSKQCVGYQIDGPDFTEVFYTAPGNY